VRGAGAEAAPARSLASFEALFPEVDRAIVDLTARAYDGIVAIRDASAAGLSVLAIGQHDDRVGRRQALAAGAGKVVAYRRMFDDGPRQVGVWLAVPGPVEAAR
jgi:hypothetical protein